MKKTKLDLDIEKEIANDPSLKEELAKADIAIEISMQIYTLRKERGLTQGQLAKMIGISQPNVARLENSDYGSYSLQTLEKIARALNANLSINLKSKEEIAKTYSFEKSITWASFPLLMGAGSSVYSFKLDSYFLLSSLVTQIDNIYKVVSVSTKVQKNSEHQFLFNFL